MAYLWDNWESEFWLKSVLKRACKRHFNDVVADIDKVDNDDYGQAGELVEPKADDEDHVAAAIKMLSDATDLDTLRRAFMATGLMKNIKVVAAKDARKAELTIAAEKQEVKK